MTDEPVTIEGAGAPVSETASDRMAKVRAARGKSKGGRPRKVRTETVGGMPVQMHATGTNAADAIEIAFWQAVQNSTDQAELHSYLDRYPEGAFAFLATRRLDRLAEMYARGQEPGGENAGRSGDVDGYSDPRVQRKAILLPTIPIPVFDPRGEQPRYQLLAPFFAENDTYYGADQEIVYLGPPNEHMLPLNDVARGAKREQEEYLNACWAVKCKAEGKPVSLRPRELADQIELERNALRASQMDGRGVVNGIELPPSRPDLGKGGSKNPNASRVVSVTEGSRYGGKNASAPPVLGRDGARYQRDNTPGFGTPPQAA